MKNRDHLLQKSLSLLNGYGFRLQKYPTWYGGLLLSGTGKVWPLLQPEGHIVTHIFLLMVG